MCRQNQSRPTRYPKNARGFAQVALVTGVVGAVLPGCGHSALAPVSPAPVAAPVSAEGQARTATAWAFIDGAELPVRLRIPFASEWQRRETKTSLRLEHPPEKSQFVVRLWPASRLVTVDQCVGELALLEPETARARQTWMSGSGASEPAGENEEVVVAQRFDPGGDFHGLLRATVRPTHGGAAVAGTVIAVAAGVGRCVGLVANTFGAGDNAEQQVADRLAWLVEGVTRSLSVRTVEGRVAGKL